MFKSAVAARQLGICTRAAFSTDSGNFPNSSSTTPENRSHAHPRSRFASRSPSRGLSPGNETSTSRILSIIDKSNRRPQRHRDQRTAHNASRTTAEDLARHRNATELTKQISRRWKTGDVYAPHDLSDVEMKKWKRRGKPTVDVFDVLELNPMVEYRNFSILSEFMTPMGRIMHSKDTGLRNVNQRKIAKAIRRAIGMGFMPSVHRHPEILMKESTRRNEPLSRVTKPI